MNKTIISVLGIFLLACIVFCIWKKPVSSPVPAAPPVAISQDIPAPDFENNSASQLGKASPAAIKTVPVANNKPAESTAKPAAAASNQNRPAWEWREMAATNLQEAVAEALKLPEGSTRNQALAAVCFGLAQSDPSNAVQLAESLGLDQQPGGTMENLVQQWASTDMASALTWANQQPTGDQRNELFTRVAYVLSQTDPSDAASLVTSEIPPGPAQDEAVMAVLHQWGNQNLIAAIGWVANFPDTPLRNRALDELEGIENYR